MNRARLPGQLRVATYNIHRGVGSDGHEDLDRIAGVLHELDADVIALQEVGYKNSPRENVAQYLADAIGATAIAGITLTDARGDYGNALLTRLPINTLCRHDISVAGREPRGAIEARLQAGQAQEIRVVATHFGLRRKERARQVTAVVAMLGQEPAGVDLLLGDFNDWFRYSRQRRRIDALLGAAPAVATFPATRPLLALDRIWVRPAALVSRLTAHRSALSAVASDHLPLLAELALPSSSP